MPDFSTITELPDSWVIPVQVERSYSRYRFAVDYCRGKDVLEVACGGGQGLGLLARQANKVVGGDLEKKNLVYVRRTYEGRKNIEVMEMDAHSLPFEKGTFDVILLYEAIYYLQSPEKFVEECRRVLRPGGVVILCTANKNWPDFNPSPFSVRYFSIPELKGLFDKQGFKTDFFGAFPDSHDGGSSKLRSFIKRTAVKLHLMPKTMKGKVLLKKLFFGGLVRLPSEFSDTSASYAVPIPLSSDHADTVHTAIYSVSRLNS